MCNISISLQYRIAKFTTILKNVGSSSLIFVSVGAIFKCHGNNRITVIFAVSALKSFFDLIMTCVAYLLFNLICMD